MFGDKNEGVNNEMTFFIYTNDLLLQLYKFIIVYFSSRRQLIGQLFSGSCSQKLFSRSRKSQHNPYSGRWSKRALHIESFDLHFRYWEILEFHWIAATTAICRLFKIERFLDRMKRNDSLNPRGLVLFGIL